MTTTEIVRLPLETPNRLSFFSNKQEVQLPEDAQQEQQTQEELDLLQSILDGMEQSDDLTVGASAEQPQEQPQQPQTQEQQISSEPPADSEPEEQIEPSAPQEQPSEEDEPETDTVNQGPAHVTVQNQDSQPEYSSEDETQSQQEEQNGSRQEQGGFFSSRPAQ